MFSISGAVQFVSNTVQSVSNTIVEAISVDQPDEKMYPVNEFAITEFKAIDSLVQTAHVYHKPEDNQNGWEESECKLHHHHGLLEITIDRALREIPLRLYDFRRCRLGMDAVHDYLKPPVPWTPSYDVPLDHLFLIPRGKRELPLFRGLEQWDNDIWLYFNSAKDLVAFMDYLSLIFNDSASDRFISEDSYDAYAQIKYESCI